ncbi:hypothetical protein L873DRAFT_1801710 [Choiromyces venosus 120613-1]|uniref:Uncharacterized protein n=1 Tax=Choiromyces venosus 120613-1 TaxID=1336337 RepID=A0A3N4K081_9PEZI|nr:hypothetical protein L873DRAFT_1801710 [Choiromyces venosus 120613-1]
MLNILRPTQHSSVSITKTAAIGHLMLKRNITTVVQRSLEGALVILYHDSFYILQPNPPEITPLDVVFCRPPVFSTLQSTHGKHCKDVAKGRDMQNQQQEQEQLVLKSLWPIRDLKLRRSGARSL